MASTTTYLYRVGIAPARVTSFRVGDIVQVSIYGAQRGDGNVGDWGALAVDANGLLPHLKVQPLFSGADSCLGKVGGTEGENAARSAETTYRVDLGQFHAPFIGEMFIDGGAVAAGKSGDMVLAYNFAYTKKPGRRGTQRPHSLAMFGAGGTRALPVNVNVPFGATHVCVSEDTAVHLQIPDGSAAGVFSAPWTLKAGEHYALGPIQSFAIDNPPAPSLHFTILV